MTTGRRISWIFVLAVFAAVAGYLAGGVIHDTLSSSYDVAVSVVSEGAELASPGPTQSSSLGTPSPLPSGATSTVTDEPAETERPHILCGPRPQGGGNVDCRLRDGDWVWVGDD